MTPDLYLIKPPFFLFPVFPFDFTLLVLTFARYTDGIIRAWHVAGSL